MIVTCTNCDTSFQLDDARVPNQGIRVRCSRCKEAFFLQHP
ncbi:MAG: zinc-ribbon domain-containing protein, partial [Deltaproteobacteria bacterium]|nr:zinc-ribbon domain-containing protein [Deltaproteobacteria bacterium]